MSNKERTKIRRNNYRAWKQAQKQKSAAPASSTIPALPVEPASPAVAPPVAQPAATEPQNNNTAPFSLPRGSANSVQPLRIR